MTWELGWNGASDIERAALLMLTLLLALGVGAYVWPAALSGPLFANEKRSVRTTISALVIPLLLLLSAGSALLLVVDPHDREPLLLVSRARSSRPDCRRVTWPARANRSLCELEGIDLGPVVDDALSAVDESRTQTMTTQQVLDAVRPRLVTSLGGIGRERRRFSEASARPSNLPRWIIDTVELELVETALHDQRFDRLVIAPGPFDRDSMWQTLAELRTEVGIETTLLDERELPSGAYVQGIPVATYESNGAVHLWALVSGPLRTPETFEFTITDGEEVVDELLHRVPADTLQRRLVSIELSCGACAGREHPLRVIASKDESPTADGSLVPAAQWERIQLVVTGLDRPLDKAIRQLFAPDFRDTRIGRHVVEELSGLGLPLPTLAQGDAKDALYVTQRNGAIVVATGKDTVADADNWSREQLRGTADPAILEHFDNSLGPDTIWSYQFVTLRGRPAAAKPTERNALSARISSPAPADLGRTVGMAGLGKGWAVAVLQAPPEPYETITDAPFLRTIVWLAAHAKYGDTALPPSRDGRPTGRIRSIDGDRAQLKRERLRTRHIVLVAALAACFIVSAARVAQSLQGARSRKRARKVVNA